MTGLWSFLRQSELGQSERRHEAAEQGYGLDKLVHDEDADVRVAVAKQGYGLEQLVSDESWLVREEVARQGYGLEQLVNDENEYVRETAKDYATEHGINIEKLNQKNTRGASLTEKLNAIKSSHKLEGQEKDPAHKKTILYTESGSR